MQHLKKEGPSLFQDLGTYGESPPPNKLYNIHQVEMHIAYIITYSPSPPPPPSLSLPTLPHIAYIINMYMHVVVQTHCRMW